MNETINRGARHARLLEKRAETSELGGRERSGCVLHDRGVPIAPKELVTNLELIQQVAFGRVRNLDDAEEVTQETCLAALRGSRERIESTRGWLCGTARYQSFLLLRSRMRRREVEALCYEERESMGPLEDLVSRSVVKQLHRQVDGLTETYREAISLRYFEGMSRAAIAGRLGLPVHTVATRLRRALNLLRGQFGLVDRETASGGKTRSPVDGAGVATVP